MNIKNCNRTAKGLCLACPRTLKIMKKRYIKPQMNSVLIEVKPLMVVSGRGTMNARKSRFNDDDWEEEDFSY